VVVAQHTRALALLAVDAPSHTSSTVAFDDPVHAAVVDVPFAWVYSSPAVACQSTVMPLGCLSTRTTHAHNCIAVAVAAVAPLATAPQSRGFDVAV
jgi:hypothetical protein